MSEIETQLRHRSGMQVVTSLRVEIVDGPDRGSQATGADTLSVGTAKDNALVVSDFTVSRYHLEAAAGPGGITITDLGSTNGTYVGAVRVEKALVPPGTLVTLGGTTIRFDDAVRRTVPATTDVGKFSGMIARSPKM